MKNRPKQKEKEYALFIRIAAGVCAALIALSAFFFAFL